MSDEATEARRRVHESYAAQYRQDARNGTPPLGYIPVNGRASTVNSLDEWTLTPVSNTGMCLSISSCCVPCPPCFVHALIDVVQMFLHCLSSLVGQLLTLLARLTLPQNQMILRRTLDSAERPRVPGCYLKTRARQCKQMRRTRKLRLRPGTLCP